MNFSILMLTSAFVLGAAHALEPGHGKTLISTHLTGSQAKWLQAIVIASLITALHALTICIYGLIAVYLAHTLLTTQQSIFQVGSVLAGGLILFLGVLWTWQSWRPNAAQHMCCEHTQNTGKPVDWLKAFWIALASSVTPCPTAILVVTAIMTLGGTNKLMEALLFLILFSAGLSTTLLFISLLMSVPLGRMMKRMTEKASFSHLQWPVMLRRCSAILMLVLGSFLTLKAVCFPDYGSLSETPWLGWLQSSVMH